MLYICLSHSYCKATWLEANSACLFLLLTVGEPKCSRNTMPGYMYSVLFLLLTVSPFVGQNTAHALRKTV